MKNKIFLLVILFHFQYSVASQCFHKKTLARYDKDSHALITRLKGQLKKEINRQKLSSTKDPKIISVYEALTRNLIHQTKQKYFIKDSILENQLREIVATLYESNPDITPIGQLLVSNAPMVNARSFGDGTLSVSLGLLAKNPTEGEMAFIIAHEIAHYHLNHTYESIKMHGGTGTNPSVTHKIKKIPEGTLSLNDLDYIQKWYYKLGRHSRTKELAADSMAYTMLMNTPYSQEEAIGALRLLKNGFEPKYPLKKELFDPFIVKELPFKKHWLSPQLNVYSKPHTFPLFKYDSIVTHPDIDIRIQKIADYPQKGHHAFKEPTNPSHIRSTSDLDLILIGTAYEKKYFDYALHLALQLKKKEKGNDYTNFFIGRLLYELADHKSNNLFHLFVPRYVKPYSNELKALNSFLHNLSERELAELSYWFSTKEENFNPSCPDHYRLLYKICFFTRRFEERKKIKNEFKNRFPGMSISSNYEWHEFEHPFKKNKK